MARVGYYDITIGAGAAYMVDEIEAAGHEAVQINDLSAAELGGIDLLYALNPSNSSFAAEFTDAVPALSDAVQNGMHLVVFDRYVTAAAQVLPGGADISFFRDFADDRQVDVAPDAPDGFVNATATPIDDTQYDNGTSSTHGYAALASLPEDAVSLLTRGDDAEVVAFAYPFGGGGVFYSSIPLDHYSNQSATSITPSEVDLLAESVFSFLLDGGVVSGVDLAGTDGADALTGTEGRDTLSGGAGDDLLVGSGSRDLLDGGEGRDTMQGGSGNDTYVVDNPGDVTTEAPDAGTDTVQSAVSYTLADNVENLIQTGSADIIGTGNGLGNVITGNSGANLLRGMGGADWIEAGAGGADTIEGGDGNDTASLASAAQGVSLDLTAGTGQNGADALVLTGIENLTGSGLGDFLRGDAGDNLIRGLGGDDWIVGSPGDDTIDGGGGRDMISYVTSQARVIVDLAQGFGLSGDARIDTYISVEQVTGTRFDDYFVASGRDEFFRGMNGYDWFVAASGFDSFDGGAAFDTVSYVTSAGAVAASLSAGSGWLGDASGDSFIAIENLTGSRNGDILTGDAERNTLRGLDGDDVLTGMAGADRLYGGTGNDTLNGGADWDRAYFEGAASEYDVSTVDGVTTVTHLNGGVDGTDTLLSIEGLVFSDGLVYL